MKIIINQENIENTELNFYEGDIFTLVSSLNSKYDLVYLSNIIDYVNKKDYKNLLSKFNLNDNGVVLSYIFSHIKKYNDFLDMCEVKEDSKEDRGVLIYKQLLQTIFSYHVHQLQKTKSYDII